MSMLYIIYVRIFIDLYCCETRAVRIWLFRSLEFHEAVTRAWMRHCNWLCENGGIIDAMMQDVNRRLTMRT